MKDYSTKVRLTIDFDIDVRAHCEDCASEKASDEVQSFFYSATHEVKYVLEHRIKSIEVLDCQECGPDVMKASHQYMEDKP